MSKLQVGDKIINNTLHINMDHYEKEHLIQFYGKDNEFINCIHLTTDGQMDLAAFKDIITCNLDVVPNHIIVKHIFEFNKTTHVLKIYLIDQQRILELLQNISTFWGIVDELQLATTDIKINFDAIMEICPLKSYVSLYKECEYMIPTKKHDLSSLCIECGDATIVEFLKMFPNLKNLVVNKRKPVIIHDARTHIPMYSKHVINDYTKFGKLVDDYVNNNLKLDIYKNNLL